MTVAELLDTLSHRHLGEAEIHAAFAGLVGGRLTDVEIAALLAALKVRGQTPAEIAGAARALREAAVPFPRPGHPVADTCGTGGDGAGTVNISTAAAFVAAEGGVAVAKHGNRASSSRCGSADVLEQLGVRLEAPPAVARRCLDRAGICFLFAPAYHPGVRRAVDVRRALRTRTLFNLLGPLANPARPEFQVMGIYDPALLRAAAETLGRLGCRSALVVHGGGLDELALHAPTRGALLRDGRVEDLTLTPEDAGLAPAPLGALAAGEPGEAAAWLEALLDGRGAPAHRDAVALNAGALLWIAGAAPTLRAGAARAREILAGGGAGRRLRLLVETSHGH
jgi:anthranilate phosphoribosyltransferase